MCKHLGISAWLVVYGVVVFVSVEWPLGRAQESSARVAERARQAKALPADPVAAEEAREMRAMERFLALLEKNPRRGTALDRVYGYHVERGSLDAFIKGYQDRVARNPKDGAGWLILGLLEFQRGQDAAAVAALRQAETARADDALPPYYLGQALVLVGQPEAAAAAFERALERKPPRNDLLEIFQALGRVYERTQKNDQALRVWNRLEALFPNDAHIQEQIATALAEENQPAQALPRFEGLAKKATDPFRQVELAMQAADLKVRLGRTDEALRDFETLLGKLRPDSWLQREVRRKVEEVFLRSDDQPGLVAYYERWTKREPEDVEALVRLGRTLASMGRAGEAQAWYEKAVKLAPSRRELRLALISQLASDQKFAEAAAQYAALDAADPNNPDTLRDWGALVLRDTAKPVQERKAAAAAIWRKMLVPRPNDPVSTAQVADLLRQAELADDALALYRKACALAPGNPQYHEYLGEYLHNLKRPQEALAAWAKIAEPPNRNAKNLARLGEVYAGFGYLKEALPPTSAAVGLDADNFELRLKLAELLHKLERYDDAEAQLASAAKLAEKDEEKSAVLEARVKNDQAADRLAMRIASLRKELESGKAATAEAWSSLARYLEADAKLPEAVRAADRAIQTDPRSIPAWTLAARVRESAGNLADSADALRRLAEIDRRNRTEHLTGVARLEARLGRTEAALKAGRDLLAAAPGNPEHYEFFAQLCFQLGKAEEGLDALRRAVRVNPNDTKITLTLAETLAGQYRTDEAIEMYWRAFDKSEDLDGKLGVVSQLTALYLQRNQLDRLLTRLQHQEKDTKQSSTPALERNVAICLAQAYASSGDLGSARTELERLLASNARDTQLLQQLSKLAEEEGDLESAARYQKQLNDLAPSDDGSTRLGQLYARYGELEEAQAVWSKMASGKSEAHRIFGAIDSLLANRKPQPVLEISEAICRKEPQNWEALYRRGLALVALGKVEEAQRSFAALLDVSIADDEQSATAKALKHDPKLKAASTRPSSYSRPATIPLEARIGAIYQIRMACKLDAREMYYPSGQAPTWAPPDFGQARMAALGWLVTLAQKKGPGKADELIASVRKAAQKTPADLRALWDWFYLCLVRYDNAGTFAAGRALSRAAPTDPLALWAYLHSLGGRQVALGQQYYVYQGEEPKDRTPPLDKEELEHVLACYRSLRTRRPELAEAQILQHVSDELKRAKRFQDEEQFYHETIAGSTQLAQVAGAFLLAGKRGDVDGLLQLFDRYDRLQTSRSSPYAYFYTGTFYFGGPGTSLAQGMSVRAGAKAYGDVLRILDHQLAAVRRKQERQSPGAARAARSRYGSRGNYSPQYQIWVGKSSRYMQIPFPLPNEYFDEPAIQLLRTAYELYKRDDLVSDLVTHFRRQAEAAKTPADALYPRLALASLFWWNDDKDEAIAEFTKVAEASKAESDLRLDLAELLEQQGQRSDALALADTVQPMDNTTMKRREELALRLAVQTGDLERAREAAERLFGLRLDTETQVRLAGQMSQLGLHELADAVLGRARRRAGNKATALVGLMLQYQREGKLDVAVQVAMQILRSTTATRQTNPNYYSEDNPDASRTAAVGVLARSGKLPQLIERALEQLKKTPNSVAAHQSLADYYKASGQRDKARSELAKIIELRPDDFNMRYQIAMQLVQDGQRDAALEHFKTLLKKEPSLLARNFYQVQSAFQQARKMDELLALLEQIDLRQLGYSHNVFNIISNLSMDEKVRERIMPLLRKAWEAFPEDRSYILTYVRRDELWQMPEMYEYAREAIVPKPATFAPANQWNALAQIIYGAGGGRMITVATRLLDMAASQGRLDELAAEVDAGRKAIPAWTAGGVLRALIDCRMGRYDEAQAIVRQFLKETNDESLSTNVYAAIGAELEDHAPTRDLAVTVYENSLSRRSDDPYWRLNYEGGPAKRLVTLYVRENRLQDARRILVDFSKADDFLYFYDADYTQQMKMRALGAAANELNDLGFQADAVALYNESLAISREIAPDGPMYFGNRDGMTRQYQEGLSRALDNLKPEDLAATLSRLIQAEDTERAKPQNRSGPESAGRDRVEHKPKKRDQFLDLMVLVHPRELDKAALRSLLAEAIASPAGGARSSGDQKGREQLAAALQGAQQKHPEDLSVAIAQALLALGSSEAKSVEQALERLSALVEKTPLEVLPEGVRANSRQRAEAARQVPLWLVAKACLKQKDAAKLDGVAAKLTARAVEAARRQTDTSALLAIYREQGELALERKDRQAAAAAWGRMLELVLEPARPKPKKVDTKDKKPPPAKPAAVTAPARATSMAPGRIRAVFRKVSYQAPAPAQGSPAPSRTRASAARTKAAAARPNVPILTLDRFEQAMQIARLAAGHDMAELSFRAVRDSLRGGPPVIPSANPNQTRMIIRRAGIMDEGAPDSVSPRVIASLVDLERLWQKNHVDAQGVYLTLRDAVLPPGRPTEVFLYAAPLNQNALRRPQSLGKLLADAAARAGKADELSRLVAARQKQVLAELPATVLSAQIALATGQAAPAAAELARLTKRLERDASRTAAELVCHAALPALDRPQKEVATAAVEALDACAKGFENSGQQEPLGTLLLILARRQLKQGDTAAGRKRLDAYMATMEKSTVRYAGDYPLYLRKSQFQRVAAEYARAGLWADALAALGRFVDAPAYSGGDPPVDEALVRLLRQLGTRPAREQYDVLSAWSMPAKDRRIVRVLTSMAARDMAPDVFSPAEPAVKSQDKQSVPGSDPLFVSTATSLIAAAAQAGTLEQLAANARAAALEKGDKKIENADVFHILVEMACGRGAGVAPAIEARLAELLKENATHARAKPQPQLRATPAANVRVVSSGRGERVNFPWTDYLASQATIRSSLPEIAALGVRFTEALLERGQLANDWAVVARLRGDLAEAAARRAGAPAALGASLPALWHPADMRPGYDLARTVSPTFWIAHEGIVAHPSGSTTDLLLFDIPLAGSYEFSIDAYTGPWSGSLLAHNGLAVLPSAVDGSAQLFPLGASEQVNIPWRLSRPLGFNRLTVQATPQKVRYLVNGHLLYEDSDPSPTSPWLGLLTFRERNSAWRHLRLRGRPEVPRRVRLSHRDRLEGWIGSFYGETLPRRRTEETTDQWGNIVQFTSSGVAARRLASAASARAKKPHGPVNLDDYDWAARDGVIYGRRKLAGGMERNIAYFDGSGSATEADQSRLYYYRPLRDGDVLTYEFLYEPGQVLVHPAIDRIAFLLEPEGIKVHWMTTGSGDLSGLAADNAAEEPANRRGPRALPLKPGAWNKLKLALVANKLTIELNGQPVYARQMDSTLGRQFGLFHFKDQTAAQVRDIVLEGRWPRSLAPKVLADLTAAGPDSPRDLAIRAARHAVIGEALLALDVDHVIDQARKLPAQECYAHLAGWVLPAPDHPLFRLEGAFSPTYPAGAAEAARPAVAREGASGASLRTRVQAGGELNSPAIELVLAAKAAGKLEELARRVKEAPALPRDNATTSERGRLALLGLIQTAGGDHAAAGKTLDAARALLARPTLDQPRWAHWPELTLAAGTLESPALRAAALALLTALDGEAAKQKPDESEGKAPLALWTLQVKNLRARALRLAQADSLRSAPSRSPGSEHEPREWATVTQARAETRGLGHPIAAWAARNGVLEHDPGHATDMLYLAVPLLGDFQLDCELSHGSGRNIRVSYAGLAVGPSADLKRLERAQLGRALADLTLNPPLEKLSDWYPYRLVRKGGRMTSFINGRKVHEAPAPAECDPWLALVCEAAESGAARKIAISGTPQIPERLNLAALPELSGWLAGDYDETTTGDNPDWDKRGDEIVGVLREDVALSKQESLLRYHRPMLEDGRIDYEFYYDPGKVMVHPALGRIVFLLEPDGAKIHRLTDGAYERTGLAPDDVREEPENRRGPASLPLKPRAWNRLVLSLTGDQVSLDLNDQLIYERPLEETNQRFFGLFHYADETQARVRSVTYQGSWPKALPTRLQRKSD